MEWAGLLNDGSNHSNHAWYLLSNVSAVLSTSGLPSLSILSPTQGSTAPYMPQLCTHRFTGAQTKHTHKVVSTQDNIDYCFYYLLRGAATQVLE